MNSFSYIFLIFLAAAFCTRLWLALRHMGHVARHRDQVPTAFASSIPLEAHQKAANYTLARTRMGLVDLTIGLVLLLAWTLGGGLDVLDRAWRSLDWPPIWTGIAFMISTSIIMSLLELPLDIYRTFRIEQRFGFNRTTPGLYVTDLIKHTLLSLVIGIPFLWLVLWLMGNAGGLWWLYVWALWMGFSLLMMWAYPAFIAPMFNRFKALEDAQLKARIEQLLARCGFASKGVFVMDGSRRSSHGNAYFTGLGNNKRIVFFDTLISSLDHDEAEAVLAHELGHFRRRHVLKRMVAMSVMSLTGLALLGWLMQQGWFYHGLGVSSPSLHAALTLFMLSAPVFTFFLQPLMALISRRHEFEADDYAATQSNALHLCSALVKLYKDNASTLTPDPLYSAFHDSHPPASVRIAHLQKHI